MKFVDTERFGRIVEQVRRRLPGVSMHTFFDVGANVGQTVGSMLAHYPEAAVYAFEPAPESFRKLAESWGELANVACYQRALGAEAGTVHFVNQGVAQTNRVVPKAGKRTTNVELQTGDSVCRELDIEHISYLKIDTEGHDLNVLRGFPEMLCRQAIDLIQVEVGLNPESSTYYTSMEDLKSHLEQAGYRLFHIQKPNYEREVRDGVKYSAPYLRYCNLIFVSRAVINSNSVPIPPRQPS